MNDEAAGSTCLVTVRQHLSGARRTSTHLTSVTSLGVGRRGNAERSMSIATMIISHKVAEITVR
jgi:hypothetical protein